MSASTLEVEARYRLKVVYPRYLLVSRMLDLVFGAV